MKQIKRILYTTDLSRSSIEVFEQTVALAAQTGASIVLLHVIEDGSSGSQNRMVHLVDKDTYEKIRKESRDRVKSTLIDKQKGIPTIQKALHELCAKTNDRVCHQQQSVTIDDIVVTYGDAADIIGQVAEATECDVIAMGFYRKGSLLKSLTGSSGRRIIKRSGCPIYLVPI